jgi:hypothetical protein
MPFYELQAIDRVTDQWVTFYAAAGGEGLTVQAYGGTETDLLKQLSRSFIGLKDIRVAKVHETKPILSKQLPMKSYWFQIDELTSLLKRKESNGTSSTPQSHARQCRAPFRVRHSRQAVQHQ